MRPRCDTLYRGGATKGRDRDVVLCSNNEGTQGCRKKLDVIDGIGLNLNGPHNDKAVEPWKHSLDQATSSCLQPYTQDWSAKPTNRYPNCQQPEIQWLSPECESPDPATELERLVDTTDYTGSIRFSDNPTELALSCKPQDRLLPVQLLEKYSSLVPEDIRNNGSLRLVGVGDDGYLLNSSNSAESADFFFGICGNTEKLVNCLLRDPEAEIDQRQCPNRELTEQELEEEIDRIFNELEPVNPANPDQTPENCTDINKFLISMHLVKTVGHYSMINVDEAAAQRAKNVALRLHEWLKKYRLLSLPENEWNEVYDDSELLRLLEYLAFIDNDFAEELIRALAQDEGIGLLNPRRRATFLESKGSQFLRILAITLERLATQRGATYRDLLLLYLISENPHLFQVGDLRTDYIAREIIERLYQSGTGLQLDLKKASLALLNNKLTPCLEFNNSVAQHLRLKLSWEALGNTGSSPGEVIGKLFHNNRWLTVVPIFGTAFAIGNELYAAAEHYERGENVAVAKSIGLAALDTALIPLDLTLVKVLGTLSWKLGCVAGRCSIDSAKRTKEVFKNVLTRRIKNSAKPSEEIAKLNQLLKAAGPKSEASFASTYEELIAKFSRLYFDGNPAKGIDLFQSGQKTFLKAGSNGAWRIEIKDGPMKASLIAKEYHKLTPQEAESVIRALEEWSRKGVGARFQAVGLQKRADGTITLIVYTDDLSLVFPSSLENIFNSNFNRADDLPLALAQTGEDSFKISTKIYEIITALRMGKGLKMVQTDANLTNFWISIGKIKPNRTPPQGYIKIDGTDYYVKVSMIDAPVNPNIARTGAAEACGQVSDIRKQILKRQDEELRRAVGMPPSSTPEPIVPPRSELH